MDKKEIAKKLLKFYAIARIPLTVYLIVILATVPAINQVEGETVLGAHRGNSIEYEENTLEAFKSALDNPKYQFIEFDIQYSKDGKIVVFHETDMFKLPKKFVSVSDMTYAEIQIYFDFKIPQYHEVMDLIQNQKPVEIEIKSHGNPEQDKELVDFIVKDLETRNCNKYMIASPTEEIIQYIEEKHPQINTGRVYWIHPLAVIPLETTTKMFYKTTDADYVLLHGYNIKNYDLLLKCKPEDKGIVFWYFTDEVYIVENPKNCEKFWELQISEKTQPQ